MSMNKIDDKEYAFDTLPGAIKKLMQNL